MKSKFLLATLSCIFALSNSPAIAATSDTTNKPVYDITSKLYINDKLVSSPHIIAHANQPASITITNKDGSSKLKMEVLAKDVEISNMQGAIGVRFDIQYANAGKTVHYNPSLVLMPDKESRLHVSAGAGESYEIYVLVKREKA